MILPLPLPRCSSCRGTVALLLMVLMTWPLGAAGGEGLTVEEFEHQWSAWWSLPAAPISAKELAEAHTSGGEDLSVRASVVRVAVVNSAPADNRTATRDETRAIPLGAFLDAPTWDRVVGSPDTMPDALLSAHGKAAAGRLDRMEAALWWEKGELRLAAAHPVVTAALAWENGARLPDPPRPGGEYLGAAVGASTLVSRASVVERLSPQPERVLAEGLVPFLSSWKPGQLLFGDHTGELESSGARVIRQAVVADPSDGAILHLIDSRKGDESILFSYRYRPEWGYLNDRATVWVARRDAQERIVAIGYWSVEHRSDFVSVEGTDRARSLPRRVVWATGRSPQSGATTPRGGAGRIPDLADTAFLAVWVLSYDGDVSDFEARLELAVEEHLKKQWEALEAAYASEEYRRLSSDPMPESVEHRQKFPQLITDRRFFLEGVATNVHYRWSRPLPSDAVIQQAAHTPGQSYLDPADRPPLPPGAPGGAAAGSASPTLTRYARWKWWSWSVAGGALLLLAVLRLARGRRPRRAA